MAHDPGADFLVLVGGVVVENDVDALACRNVSLKGVEEADELLMPVALHVPSEDLAGQDVQRREQRGRAMPLVVVGDRRAAALLQRQSRLGAVERLDLGLLIETEHHGMGWRCDIQAHDVMQLLDEGGVLRQFEYAPAMWTEPVRGPSRHRASQPSPSPVLSSGSPRAAAAPASAGPPRRSCRR